MTVYHGTSAEAAGSIERLGLIARGPYGGTYVTSSLRYARWAAQTACLRLRHERGGQDLEAQGLIVHVDPGGLTGQKTGVFDFFVPSWKVERIEPARIVSMEVITVHLPKPGGADEVGILRGGFGFYRPSASSSCVAGGPG